ncbi:MAG: ABC transporter permease subunit [Dermatophilaceae bacterium]
MSTHAAPRHTAATGMPLHSQVWRESWRGLTGWAVALAAVCAAYLPFHASMSTQMMDLINTLPPSLVKAVGYDQMISGAGYAQATIFGLIGFVLATIAVVGWGTKAVAGDEESGTLELTLAHGVSRSRVVLERALGVVSRLLVLGVVALVAISVMNGPARLDLTPSAVLPGAAAFVGLTGLFGLAALAGGAVTGQRSVALGVGAGLAVASYVLNALGKQNTGWEWMLHVSPYGWAYQHDPLSTGWDWGGLGLLLAGWAACLVAAVAGLRRRDVGT